MRKIVQVINRHLRLKTREKKIIRQLAYLPQNTRNERRYYYKIY